MAKYITVLWYHYDLVFVVACFMKIWLLGRIKGHWYENRDQENIAHYKFILSFSGMHVANNKWVMLIPQMFNNSHTTLHELIRYNIKHSSNYSKILINKVSECMYAMYITNQLGCFVTVISWHISNNHTKFHELLWCNIIHLFIQPYKIK